MGFAQVGIGTTTPNASLDVSKTDTATSQNLPQGILIPRMTGDEIKVMTVDINQNSMLVYATVPATSRTSTVAEYIDSEGFYYYNASQNRFLKLGANSSVALKGCYISGTYAHNTFNDFDLGLAGINSDKYQFILHETGSNLQYTTITGFKAGIDGQLIKISTQQHNFGIKFINMSSSSAVGNRINCAAFAGQGDLAINSRGFAVFMYQISDKTWHLVDFRINNP